MKLAFIYPEVLEIARFKDKRKEFPPFGVLYLAAIADKHGCNVEIFPVSPRQTGLNLKGFDIVAFSIPSSATYQIIKTVREGSIYSDRAIILVGGVHATIYPEETYKDLKPRLLLIGEAENTLSEVLDNYHRGDYSNVCGLMYEDANGLVYTAKRELETNISRFPMPARHLIPRENFIMTDRLSDSQIKMTHVIFSRGCPFRCAFCAGAQTPVRYRSWQNIRAELIHLVKTYGIGGFAVTDDNFLIKKQHVKKIAAKISDLSLKWSALSRVDTVDEEMLRSITAAGCIEVKFGIESGSEKILRAMKKNITRNQIRFAISKAKELGLIVKVFIVHGFPGENYETTIETITLLNELRSKIDRVSLFRFVPLPGSDVFNDPKTYGLKLNKLTPDGNIDWGKYRIYHNPRHWWGNAEDYHEVNKAHDLLKQYIASEWPGTFDDE